MFLVGLVGSHMILRSYTILHDPTIFTILYDPTRSYNFYDLNTILNVLVRWDHKIVWSYNLDRDFDNHDYANCWRL